MFAATAISGSRGGGLLVVSSAGCSPQVVAGVPQESVRLRQRNSWTETGECMVVRLRLCRGT